MDQSPRDSNGETSVLTFSEHVLSCLNS
jgi:hypothetical protein